MIYWLLQLLDLIVYDFLHLFLVFGALCWLIWFVRLAVSSRYEPFEGKSGVRPAVSVLVPIFQEETDDLKRNLASILANMSDEDEIFAIFDERDDRREELDLEDRRLRRLVAPPGKRPALAQGIREASNPIILVTASDTKLDESTIPEILKPFEDPEIGGVCGNVNVVDDKGFGAKCYKWALRLRNLMVYPAMSRSGTVHVLNGECYAVRRKLALSYLDEFTNQVFLGKTFDSGDDGWMTTLLLRHGHKTVFQSTAKATTIAPRSLRSFMRQQLRWNRNSTRRTLHAITKKWAYRRGAIYPFHLFVTLIRAPFWMVVIILAIIRILTGTGIGVRAAQWFEPTWSDWRIVFFIVAVILVRCLRGLPYLLREKKAFLFLPFYAFIAPFLLAPMKVYAMLTARNARWITRGGGQTGSRTSGLASKAALSVLFLLLVVAFPLGGLALALTADEMDTY